MKIEDGIGRPKEEAVSQPVSSRDTCAFVKWIGCLGPLQENKSLSNISELEGTQSQLA